MKATRCPPELHINGLRQIYGHRSDQRVWAYLGPTGTFEYRALPVGDKPPQLHSIRPDHQLHGWLDLAQPQGQPVATAGAPATSQDWPILIFKLLVAIVVASFALFMGLVRFMAGVRR